MKDTECYVNKAEVKRKIRVWLDYRTSRQVTDGLLDLIEKLPVTVKSQLETTLESNWISVKDRLPEEGENVLTYGARPFYDVFYINRLINKESGEWLYDGVTHWMPLPEPPKDDAEYDRAGDDAESEVDADV